METKLTTDVEASGEARETGLAGLPWREAVEKAVAAADPNVLRMVLYQYTRDSEYLGMVARKQSVRQGVSYRYALSDADAAKVRANAIELFAAAGSRDALTTPAPPTESEARQMIDALVGEQLTDVQFAWALEELAIDEFPRDVPDRLAALPKEAKQKVHVAIIGAGITGIVVGTMLERAGVPYTIFERHGDIGGTWEANTYPRARCDIPVFLYQFRFEKNYPWLDHQPTQPDLKEYLKYVSEKQGVTEHVHFNSEVEHAAWNDETQKWELLIEQGEGKTTFEANFLIHGGSFFGTPKKPELEGMENFTGPIMHTAEWDHDVDLTGKKLGIIGNGSSGVQIVPHLAEIGTNLTVFQRTAQWVMPSENYNAPLPGESRWLLDNIPFYWNWVCCSYFLTSRQDTEATSYDRVWQARGGAVSRRNDEIRDAALAYYAKKFADRPDLHAKLIPEFPPYARRNVVDSGWHDSLLRPDVDLVTEPIRRMRPEGIETGDGQIHELDALILATGFDVHRWFWPVSYVGREGKTFDQLWARDGARSFLGLVMPSFPNMFAYHGPNGAPMFGGYHPWAELWTRYVLDVIALVIERDAKSFEVRGDVFERYNKRMDQEFQRLVVQGEHVSGYFIDNSGRASTFLPWDSAEYYDWIRYANADDYDIR